MLLEEEIEIFVNNTNIEYYKSKGYENLPIFGKYTIKAKDLHPRFRHKVLVRCDDCNEEKHISFVSYHTSITLKNGFYYCKKCSNKYTVLSEESKIKKLENQKKTFLKNYGVDNPRKSKEIQEKTKNTNLEKYGVENVSQIKEVREHNSKVMKELYPILQEKTKNTNLERYGVENVFQNKDVISLIKNKNENKSLEQKEEEIKKRRINRNNTTIEKYKNLLDLNRFEIIYYSNSIFTIKDLNYNENFDIHWQTLHDRLLKHKITPSLIELPIGNNKISGEQIDVQSFLEEININFELNNNAILEGKDIDIYIPDKKIAIEYNGLYWHSEKYVKPNYHKEKSLKCLEKGIQLIHIFSDDWIHKQDIIKSIIKDKLGIHDNILYARKTLIKEVSSKEAMIFLNDNHIQGGCGSNIKLGLYFNNELVSLMTFGYRYINSKKEYELLRFCNKINTKIIGGASKLFNYFKNNYQFDIINSYSDLNISHGKLYEILGFKYSHLSKPNYYWIKNEKRFHRFNFNKKKLIKEGFDSSKTEVEIMYERGYYRIFGCGQMKWIYTK